MSCTRISLTGGTESLLFKDLYDNIAEQNEAKADEMFLYFKSEAFIEDFGDYISDYKNNVVNDRVNDNGEPKLEYNETAKKYYYTNKNNEKVFYPLVDRGLRALFSYEQIDKISSRFANNYFKGSNLDFNNIDFNNGEKLPNLSNFIQKQIVDKITSLNEAGGLKNKILANTLSKSLNYVDDFVKNVENIFKEKSITIEETDDVDGNIDVTAGEEGKDPVFNQHSAERNTKDSVNTNVKLMLSLLEDVDNLDPIWGEPTFLSMDKVYSDLQFVLANITPVKGEDIFQLQLNALNIILSKKPYLYQLHQYLNDPKFTEDKKAEFSQAFNLLKNNHIVSTYSEKNGVIVHNTLQISDSGSKTSSIKEQWDTNFQDTFLNKDNTLKEPILKNLVQKAIPEIKQLYKDILSKRNAFKDLDITEQTDIYNDFKVKVFTYLDKLGIETTENGAENYLDNYGELVTVEDKFKNLITLTEQTSYLVNGLSDKYSQPTKDYSSFLNLSQTFTDLAKSEAFFLSDGSDATIIAGKDSSGKAKQKWIYSYPAYITTKIKQWKEHPEILFDLYYSSANTEGSYYMGILTGAIDVNGKPLKFDSLQDRFNYSSKMLEKLDVGIMNQMSADGNYKSTTDLAYSDYIVDTVNKVLKGDDFIRTTTQADKTTEHAIKTGISVSAYKSIKNENGLTISAGVKQQTVDIFFNYLASDVNRMIEASKEVEEAQNNPSIKLTPHYHYQYQVKNKEGDVVLNNNVYDKSGNAFRSQIFEKLSYDAKNKSALEKQITDRLYDSKGNVLFDKLTKDSDPILYDLFEEYFQGQIFNSFIRTRRHLVATGVLEINQKGDYIVVKVDNQTLSKKYPPKKIAPSEIPYAVTMDYLVNNLISNIEYSKMFSGDVAYYKNMVDYKKRIPATYTDGLQLRITPGNETFNIATAHSIIRKSPFYDKLVEDLTEKGARPYEKINSADAQAWITPQRWKFLIKGLGKWSKVHDEVYRKMTSDKLESYTEKELKIAAQPLKGVFFGRDATGKPTYLKYSQAVLSKALIQGSDLEIMYDKMIENKVDELITFDGVKAGAIEPTLIHDENGNMLKDFSLNVQTLSNRDWKLQQDLPTKGYKDIPVGSQIQKNIFAGLIHNQELDGFMLNGKSYTGKEIMNEIVKTVSGLSDKGLQSLKKEFGIDDDFKIGNIAGFYKALIRELEQRGGSENVIKALETETTIVGIPQSAGKLYNIFASVMKSRLIKIKTNGGSFIQMSNFGLNKIEGNAKGVIWNETALETTHEPQIYIDPDTLRETVRPGGILISGAFIGKYIPNWREKSSKELFGYKNENGEFIKGLIDPKILDNIIGYRIPNQGLASNDALQIVGILPESSGDTIVAYTGITTKTGSDFDVDKMYIMFPEFFPDTKITDKVYNYIRQNLKGKTKSETIDNINSVIDQINPDYDESFNVEEFAETMFNISNVNDTQDLEKELYKDTVKLFINVLRKTKKPSPLLTYIKDELNFDNVESLKYNNKSLGNRLIELYKSVLTHPKVHLNVMQPIDIDFIEKEIKELYPDNSNNFLNHFDPEVDTKLRYSLLGGKAGVGQEANAMVDVSRPGSLTLSDVKNIKWGFHNAEGESIFDKEFSEELSEEDLTYYVDSIVDKNASKERIEELKNELRTVKTIDSLTAILNAFVDIAKDPFISKGNWTTSTTNVGNMLLRLGAHPLYVVNFLANDVITQYVDFQKSKEGLTENEQGDIFELFKTQLVINNLNNYSKSKDFNVDLGAIYKKQFDKLNIEDRISNLKHKLKKGFITQLEYDNSINDITDDKNKALVILNKKLKLEDSDLKNLVDEIVKIHKAVHEPKTLDIFDRKTNQYDEFKLDLRFFRNQNKIKNKKESSLMFQINLLHTFKDLTEYSKNLRNTVMLSKIDTDGFGKDHNQLFGIFNLYQQVIDDENNNVRGSIRGFNTKLDNTVLGIYWNQLQWVKNVVEANPLLFPSGMKQAKNIFNHISIDLYDKTATDSELLTDLSKHYNSYLMSRFFNLNKEDSQKIINELPKQVEEFKKQTGDKYFMLNELKTKVYKNNKLTDSIILGNSRKNNSYDRSFTNSWKDLFIDNPKLAEDLVKYSFITSGFQINTSQFFTFIPSEYFNQNNINREIQQISEQDHYDFIDKFYLNNLENKKYVKKVSTKQIFSNEKTSEGKEFYENGFIMKIANKGRRFVELNEGRNLNADPLQVVKGKYYKLVGYTEAEQAIYQRIEDVRNVINDKPLVTYSNDLKVKSEIKVPIQVEEINVETPTDVYDDISAEDFLNSLNYGNEPMFVEPVTKPLETTENIEIETVDNPKYYEDNIKPEPNTVFVFGSNPEGRHGAGAAKIAKEQFGAIYGQGEGLQGQSYALPTKDLRIKENKGYKSISAEQITENIKSLYNVAKENPTKQFKIGYRNTTEMSLNGYTGLEMIEMFNNAGVRPKNIIFSKEWFDTGLLNETVDNQSQQQDLFSSAATNFEQVKKQWLDAGYTKEDWNNMNEEEREHIIKNCL